MAELECIVKVPIFEGPLDLLLHLVRKNKLDIFDLPMSLITEQYLQYLELMKALDLEIAGEYMLMAATLIYIKSQMLLPREESPEEPEDPRLQIVEPLLELAKYQEAAKWLWARPLLGREVFVPKLSMEAPAPSPKASLFELLEALNNVLRKELPRVYEVARARILIAEKMAEIRSILPGRSKIFLKDLLSRAASREEAIAYFLALLEMALRQEISVLQNYPWAEVEIVRR